MTKGKFKVVATIWDANLEKQIKVVVGEFDRLANARIFKKAYEDHYSAETELIYE